MPHPKFGDRFTCFQCGIKFYDMGKPKPVCPKCGANQKKAPKRTTVKIPKVPAAAEDYDSHEDELIAADEEIDELPTVGEGESLESDADPLVADDISGQDY